MLGVNRYDVFGGQGGGILGPSQRRGFTPSAIPKTPVVRCRYCGFKPGDPNQPGKIMVAVNLCNECQANAKPFNERLLPKRVA